MGRAHSVPTEGTVSLTPRTVTELSDDELASVIGHEMRHLLIGPPGWLARAAQHREPNRRLSWVLFVLFGAAVAYGAVVGVLLHDDSTQRRVLMGMPPVLIVGALVMFVLWAMPARSQRYELDCDAELAHAVGERGISALEFDPLHDEPGPRWTFTHPHPVRRARTRRQHAYRRDCGCRPRPPWSESGQVTGETAGCFE